MLKSFAHTESKNYALSLNAKRASKQNGKVGFCFRLVDFGEHSTREIISFVHNFFFFKKMEAAAVCLCWFLPKQCAFNFIFLA